MEQEKENQKVSYRDLSDGDFIRNLDKLSQGYYEEYFAQRANVTSDVDTFVSTASADLCTCHKQVEMLVQPAYSEATKKRMGIQKDNNGFTKRNVLPIVCLLLLALSVIFCIVTEFVKIDFVSEFLAIYIGKERLYFSDALLGFIGKTSQAVSSPFTENYAQEGVGGVFAYIMLFATVLYAVLTLVLLVKSIVALCDRKGQDGYRKRNFGGIGFLMILCGLLMTLYPLLAEKFTVGYGVFIYVGIAVLVYILSWTIYWKKPNCK